MSILYVSANIQIPLAEIEFSFARSGGPGGQNVNKVNSKAVMRWNVTSSYSIPYDVRRRFSERFATRITQDGELIITSQKHRDQASNVDDCLEKLRAMLEAVAEAPTQRRATRPTLASKKRRVETKALVGQKKQQRKVPRFDD